MHYCDVEKGVLTCHDEDPNNDTWMLFSGREHGTIGASAGRVGGENAFLKQAIFGMVMF